MQKLYCYVDETGQDTKGRLFLVSIVITGEEREKLNDFLIQAEKESGKKNVKWHKADFALRKAYLAKVFSDKLFCKKIFFGEYNGKSYVDLTILATAQAILKRAGANYKADIIVDGLSKTEVHRFAAGIRKLNVKTKKVRGVRDETEPLIRLADAVAGFLRDYIEGQDYAKGLYEQAEQKNIIARI